MNRKIRKLAAAVLTLAVLILAFPGQMFPSYAATGKITFSDPTVSVGNQVSVTMKIASSDGTGLGNSDVMLEYDASALEFISGTNANGGAGSVRVVGNMESANQTTFSFTLKFKALRAGTTSITVKSQEVYDADSRTVTIEHVGNSSVKVNAPENASGNADLASLTISPGSLSPAFSADVTEYTAMVSQDVDKITVSAPAKDSKASVVVEGADALEMGENSVVCKVTAEDGTSVKTYTITITKVEGDVEEQDEKESGETEMNGLLNVEEGNWSVSETFDADSLPDGFTVTECEYDGAMVQAGVNEQGVLLIHMTDEDGNSDFFVYDRETGILAPYVTVRMAEKTILVLPPEEIPEDVSLPEGFRECTIDIGEHTVHGWIWGTQTSEAPEYCVVFGQNADGEKNFYRYDQKEMTLQRYFQDPDAEELRRENADIVSEYNSLVDDYTIRGYMIAGLFGACILLVIILIVLLLTRKPGNRYVPDENSYDRKPETKQKKSGRREEAGKTYEDDEPELVDLDLDREEEKTEIRPITVRSKRSVAEMERDIASNLAREAGQASEDVRSKGTAPDNGDLDDDFEFIDLDL